jgi:oligosaccharide repeat unit polymerase
LGEALEEKKAIQLTKRKAFPYIVYTVLYVLALVFAEYQADYGAAVCLMAAALYLYLIFARKGESLVDLKALFSLSWVGGEGIACLKLSRLSAPWEPATWFCFFLAYLSFCIGYDIWFEGRPGFLRSKAEKRTKERRELPGDERMAKRILFCIAGLMLCSIACFCLEAVVVGYIPILSSKPHAYSYFHVSGVHYFTISCILIPGLSLLYWKLARGAEKEKKGSGLGIKEWGILLLGNLTAFAIPIICVSRFQLLFALGFAGVIYLLLYRRISWKMVVAGIVLIIPLYVLLTVFRHHDVDYLNGIFEMKNSSIPIFITQPYIYVANNFENFNCMVRDLVSHSWGSRMLFPVWALTGLKFVFPQLTAAPVYITKAELTTLTLFYDAYYDFGICGIFVFALALGALAGWMKRRLQRDGNPVFYMFYGQMAIYLGLSFFTTWFSNPTTWFWAAATFMMYLLVGYRKRRKEQNEEGSDRGDHSDIQTGKTD